MQEQQTPLHIASRLGNVDIVMLLLQHNADLDAVTKDMYTPLHIAAKEGQDEVAAVLLEHGANNTAATKRGFTPLHLAAKYGNIKVARLLIQKDAPVDAQGKVRDEEIIFSFFFFLCPSSFFFRRTSIIGRLLSLTVFISPSSRRLRIEWRDPIARGQPLRSSKCGSSLTGQGRIASRGGQKWIYPATHRRQEESSQSI